MRSSSNAEFMAAPERQPTSESCQPPPATGTRRMQDVPGEASFEPEASDQSRGCTGSRRRWTGSFAGGKRISFRSCDGGSSAISEHRIQSTPRSSRRGNNRRESCYIPRLRQGKRHPRLHAGSDGLRRLRLRRSWLWLCISRLRWLQRRRLRRRRLRRLLRIVGRLPSLLSEFEFCVLAATNFLFL